MMLRCVRGQHPCRYERSTLRAARAFTTTTAHHAANSSQDAATFSSDRTRNIGIIAHIDAGKTTTTERMLYYSGFTRRIGDVDEGSTVTDFLPAERARGITIQSAAISFSWPPNSTEPPDSSEKVPEGTPRSQTPHNINLIDTPGHADFTFEVLRSLRVLDGAVCILDGVAGVEAQTEKVWSQANAYAIPRIIFINKLDRDGAAFGRTVREIGARLGSWPAVCGVPWFDHEGSLRGVGDVVQLRGLKYRSGGDGKEIDMLDLDALTSEDRGLADELRSARIALVELLSEHDDEMVEHYLEADEDHLAISPEHITRSLRKCTLQTPQLVAPVFAGASFRNVGVQPLLDAVVDLLPSPEERPDSTISLDASTQGGLQSLLSGELKLPEQHISSKSKKLAKKGKPELGLKALEACALAFKVVADAKRGVLVYVRVYSGSLDRGSSGLWNTNLQQYERAPRLLKMFANDAVEIPSISAGQIGVIPGLKLTRTGDTLVQYAAAAKSGPPRPFNSMQLRPIHVPPPVFFVSVEPNSLSEERAIRDALDILLREDPSLHVSVDEESGQTHLAGMGELHLEIARDRLINDFKAKARIGKIEIGYREMLTAASDEVTDVVDRDASKAGCTVRLEPRMDAEILHAGDRFYTADLHDNNSLIVSAPSLHRDGSPVEEETPGIPEHLTAETVNLAIQNGIKAGLGRGPAHRYAMHSTQVNVTLDPTRHLFANTTPSAISAAARQAVTKALKQSCQVSETVMMEPVMFVTISVDEESMGSVVHDLSSARGGSVVSLGSAMDEDSDATSEGPMIDVRKIYAPIDAFAGGHSAQAETSIANAHSSKQIIARVPLKEMVGYLKHLRSLTAGRGTFTMTVDRFEKMSGQRQKAVLNTLRGDYDF